MLKVSEEIRDALETGKPVVALESTVIAHGLPHPENLETALQLEAIVRKGGAIPATIAVLKGKMRVGLSSEEIEFLATSKDIRKISTRDLPIALAKQLPSATTVSTTIEIAHRAGIGVFATGGIGGVHRGDGFDVSADLPALASIPITTVCSGAKIVLNLPATREWLETNGVTILGFQCDEFPAFYSRSSGLDLDERIENAEEAAAIIRIRDQIGLKKAILVAVPVPPEFELEKGALLKSLADVQLLAEKNRISGKDVTPFLLKKLSEESQGKTLVANIALLKNNAAVAAKIAVALH